MVIALFILMVAILLTAEYFSLSKKISAGAAINSNVRLPISTEVIERYFHRSHSWVLVRSSKEVIAGVDDFSQRFIGSLSDIDLPQAGSLVRQGESMVTMKHGNKSLPAVAPVSGTILEVNTRLKNTPEIINDSPFDKGWIVKIAPNELTLELRSLFKGVTADRWQEAVRAHLIHWFSPRLGTVMQDGGEIVDNISDLTNSEEWRILVDEFFPHSTSNKYTPPLD